MQRKNQKRVRLTASTLKQLEGRLTAVEDRLAQLEKRCAPTVRSTLSPHPKRSFEPRARGVGAVKHAKDLKPLTDVIREEMRRDIRRNPDAASEEWQHRGYTRQQIAGVKAALSRSGGHK